MRSVAEVKKELLENPYIQPYVESKLAKDSGRRTVTCSICGDIGHNKRYHK